MNSYDTLLLEDAGDGVIVMTIDRPERRNAISEGALRDLTAAIGELERDGSAKVIVLTGAGGKAFCIGADIEEGFGPGADVRSMAALGQETFNRIENCRKPVIAAVNGYALGGGCELMMACDLSIAAENAQFGQPETGRGLTPGWGATQRLPRLVGRSRAMRILLEGARIRAREAERIGLVDRVVPKGEALNEAVKLAKKLAAVPAHCLEGIKRAVNSGLKDGVEKGLAAEAEAFCDAFRILTEKGDS